jgi:hypothetical protein
MMVDVERVGEVRSAELLADCWMRLSSFWKVVVLVCEERISESVFAALINKINNK